MTHEELSKLAKWLEEQAAEPGIGGSVARNLRAAARVVGAMAKLEGEGPVKKWFLGRAGWGLYLVDWYNSGHDTALAAIEAAGTGGGGERKRVERSS